MFGLGKQKGLVGLDIGSSSVKVVELKKKGDGYELLNLGIEALGQDTVVDGAIMDSFTVSTAIEAIFNQNKISTKNVATAVSGHSVIVKKIAVNAPSEEEVANAIPYEAQQYIPFDMADVNLSYQVLGPATAGPGLPWTGPGTPTSPGIRARRIFRLPRRCRARRRPSPISSSPGSAMGRRRRR